MPELPEVQTVRATLSRRVLGQTITKVTLHRADVVRGGAVAAGLGEGQRVRDVVRHGKQLALVTGPAKGDRSRQGGAAVCVHLGMSGSLTVAATDQSVQPHTHVVWRLSDGSEVRFRDPRRFGGVWVYPDEQALREERWSALGPDALAVKPAQLHRALGRTSRAIKAALLDQSVVAGLGNIYVDELLHGAGVLPFTPADRLTLESVRRMVRRMRTLLERAIAAGGTSVRDYVDGKGRPGGFQRWLRVYGRAGEPCLTCGTLLAVGAVAGRTTVWCPSCQGG